MPCSRVGPVVPAWGPELLARHQLVGITDTLPDLYAEWEEWAADVAETHTTYPVLLLFRSPEPWYSWLLGLIAVLDAAAMHLALAPSRRLPRPVCVFGWDSRCSTGSRPRLGWEVDPDPNPEGPIDLTFAEFERAVAMLVGVGFATERSAEEAWADFRGWRVNYETRRLRTRRPPHRTAGPLVGAAASHAIGTCRTSAPASAPPRWRRTVRLRPATGGHRSPAQPPAPQSAPILTPFAPKRFPKIPARQWSL